MRTHRLVVAALLGHLGVVAAACGDDTQGTGGEAPAIVFSAPGSLVTAAGKGTFRFGAASAATQIEDQNPNTDWWAFTAPEASGGLGKGKAPVGEASRGFQLAVADVALLTDLNLDSYRFSMEWARIEPVRDQVDPSALDHYDEVVDALVLAGVRPVVTVHHFSNPVWLHDPRDVDCAAGMPTDANLCGLGHPVGGPLIIEEARQHAALLASRYGDRIDDWGTVNEPVNYLLAAYGVGSFPPGRAYLFPPSADGLLQNFVPVVRDYLKLHAAIYQAIRENDTVDADGDGNPADIGMSLSVASWAAAAGNQPSDAPLDVAAKDRITYVYHHLFVDSVLNGSFDSDLDGQPDEQIPELLGTIDWLGVQYYFRAGVTGTNGLIPVLELTPCFAQFDFGACLPPIADDGSKCVPAMKYEFYEPGIYDVLKDYAARYPNLPLVVSESGLATENGTRRAEHVVRSLEQIAKAQAEGVDVRGYYHWSLFDNFEWAEGFEPRFGLHHVNYQSYARTPTEGATVLAEIAKTRQLSAAQRKKYGGLGPMSPEPGASFDFHCGR